MLLRLVQRADPRHATTRRALRRLQAEGHTLQAAAQNFIEFWNVATRPADQNGFGLLPGPEAAGALAWEDVAGEWDAVEAPD